MNFAIIINSMMAFKKKFVSCMAKNRLLKLIFVFVLIFFALAALVLVTCMFIPKPAPAALLCLNESLNYTISDPVATAVINDTLVSDRSEQAKNFVLDYKMESNRKLLKQFLVSLCVTCGALGFLGLTAAVTGAASVPLAASVATSAGIATATTGWMLTSSLFFSSTAFLPPGIIVQTVVETGIVSAESSGGSGLSPTVISGVVAATAVGASVALGASAPEAAAIGAASGVIASQVFNSTKPFKDVKSFLGAAAVPAVAGSVASVATKLIIGGGSGSGESADIVVSVCKKVYASSLIDSFILETAGEPLEISGLYMANALYEH